jgi:Glycosyl hydrolase family 12
MRSMRKNIGIIVMTLIFVALLVVVVHAMGSRTVPDQLGGDTVTYSPPPAPAVTVTAAPTQPSAAPSSYAWCSAAAEGTWAQPGHWVVQNDAWSGGHGPQTVCANSYRSWEATSDQAAGNTAVETYPDSQENFGPATSLPADPFSTYKAIFSSFSETMPSGPGISAEAAYDVWWGNGWGDLTEMMIWVDTVNRSLAGGTPLGTAVISGQTFSVWRYGGSEYIFRLNHNETSGTVNIQASGLWLVQHGYMSASLGLTAVPFGFEICSTDGTNKTFQVSSFSITTERK